MEKIYKIDYVSLTEDIEVSFLPFLGTIVLIWSFLSLFLK